MALEEGANVNVDETWCRYQTHFGHRKTYMWCLVNRKLGIVIFFYEDTVDKNGKKHSGGRRRAVLKEFLGDKKIKSLQSDGYNVYMYLDDEMVDIEHICCLAHVHNKLQEAKKLGYVIVDFFLSQIKKLYKREKLYASKPDYYTPGASRMLAMMNIQTAFSTHSYRYVSNNTVTVEIFLWTMSSLGTRVEGTLAARLLVACYQRDARTLSSWHSLHAHNKIS